MSDSPDIITEYLNGFCELASVDGPVGKMAQELVVMISGIDRAVLFTVHDHIISIYSELELVREDIDSRDVKINNLHRQLKISQMEIAQLKQQIGQLKQEITQLRQENTQLNLRVTSLENQQLLSKIRIGIQDLNAYYSWEHTADSAINNFMKRCYIVRLGTCHYVLENENKEVAHYKMRLLRDHLRTMPPEIGQKLKCPPSLIALIDAQIPADINISELD